MLSRQEYIQASIEINLFFQRIMKEHLFLIETNLQPVEIANIKKARMLKHCFEKLLAETVYYADGVISDNALQSNEFVTPYTLKAEEVTSILTGAKINTDITKNEYELISDSNCYFSEWFENAIDDLNRRSYNLLEEVISFKKKLLSMSLECKIFLTLYQEMLEHVTREAEYYQDILNSIQKRNIAEKSLCDELSFWNNIMSEHAQFIDGMLDPTEKGLKHTAAETAKAFEELAEECIRVAEEQIVQSSIMSTEGIIEYKTAATQGILQCKIKSIIPPILADHVLREANHYLRLLMMMEKQY